jgi:hypothetical protein
MGYASTNETSTATHIIAVVQYRWQTETSVIDVVSEITPTLTLSSTTQHQNTIKHASPRHKQPSYHHELPSLGRKILGEVLQQSWPLAHHVFGSSCTTSVAFDFSVTRVEYSTLGVLASLLRRAQGSSLHIDTHIDPFPACNSTLNKRESVVLWMFPRRDVINGPSPKRSDNVRTRNISCVSGPFASGTPYSSLTAASYLYEYA